MPNRDLVAARILSGLMSAYRVLHYKGALLRHIALQVPLPAPPPRSGSGSWHDCQRGGRRRDGVQPIAAEYREGGCVVGRRGVSLRILAPVIRQAARPRPRQANASHYWQAISWQEEVHLVCKSRSCLCEAFPNRIVSRWDMERTEKSRVLTIDSCLQPPNHALADAGIFLEADCSQDPARESTAF